MELISISQVAENFAVEKQHVEYRFRRESGLHGVSVIYNVERVGVVIPEELYKELFVARNYFNSFVIDDPVRDGMSLIPLIRNPTVYFLINAGELVYIGKSKNLLSRIATHIDSEKQFDSLSYFEVKLEMMDIIEQVNILHHLPPLNALVPTLDFFNKIVEFAMSSYSDNVRIGM